MARLQIPKLEYYDWLLPGSVSMAAGVFELWQQFTSNLIYLLPPFFQIFCAFVSLSLIHNGVSAAGAQSSTVPAKPASSESYSEPDQTLCQPRRELENRVYNLVKWPDSKTKA